MTGNEVIQAIKLALDKYSASTSAVIGPAFLDEELCAFANQAMVEIISTKFTGNNQLQQGFEQSVKRVSDLERLIVSKECDLNSHIANSYKTAVNALSDESFLFLVSATVSLLGSDNKRHYMPAELVDRATASKFIQTPINSPWIPVPKVTTYQVSASDTKTLHKGLLVYLDPDTFVDYVYTNPKLIVEYVIQPSGLTVGNKNNEGNLGQQAFQGLFPDTVLYEIINRAALLALDNIESQRVESKAALNKVQE